MVRGRGLALRGLEDLERPLLDEQLLLVGREAHDRALVEVEHGREGPARWREVRHGPHVARDARDLVIRALIGLRLARPDRSGAFDLTPGGDAVLAEAVLEVHALGRPVVIAPADGLAPDGIALHRLPPFPGQDRCRLQAITHRARGATLRCRASSSAAWPPSCASPSVDRHPTGA